MGADNLLYGDGTGHGCLGPQRSGGAQKNPQPPITDPAQTGVPDIRSANVRRLRDALLPVPSYVGFQRHRDDSQHGKLAFIDGLGGALSGMVDAQIFGQP